MTDIHREIFVPKQIDLIPFVSSFAPSFYLVGGTGLALQYGHRRSIDFDLFSMESFDNQKIRNKIRREYKIEWTHVDSQDELTLVVNSVRCTFYRYPYPVPHPVLFDGELTMPDPPTIAAMKAFALGRRAKWKDYVDLYYVFREHPIGDVIGQAKEIFQQEFDEKLFREQLAYHQDINYSEAVQYMPGYEVPDKRILDSLIQISIS